MISRVAEQGALRFTTSEARNAFASAVLHDIVPTDKVLDLARRLDARVAAHNGGRKWMGAHMRRGDCAWFVNFFVHARY